MVTMSLQDRSTALARITVLGLALLLFSTNILADEEGSQKPEDWDKRLEMLRSVPYLSLSEGAVDEGDTGVVLYDPELACNGYNLYCTLGTGEVFVLDMEGRVMHRWACKPAGGPGRYQHALMLSNGDLLVIKENKRLLRFDWNSELIWKKELKAHHDIAPTPDGSFYVCVQNVQDYRELKVSFDGIVHLTADGEEMDRWSTFEHLTEIKGILDTRSFLDTILDSIQAGQSPQGRTSASVIDALRARRAKRLDYFHLNTVSLLPATALGERDSRFRQGNLLICFRNVNQIAVLEKDSYRLLWAWGEGQLDWPHHPTMLENGHILIFDNGNERGYSRIVELDPVDETVVWEYKANPPDDFFTFGAGSVQRLPNGNTLICESNKGRVFEVTQAGEMVWMWLNPVTLGNRRVTVYRMMRLLPAEMNSLLGD
jgi:hypothetical protein